MRQAIYISILLFSLTACNQNGSTTNKLKPEIAENNITTDTSTTENIGDPEINPIGDSLIIFPYDSVFSDMNLVLTEISEKQYKSYLNKYKISCVLDSGRFIKGSGISISHECSEICTTYLCEKSTHQKLMLPTDYDGGILGMLLSPSCGQLLIYSSYDGPDFEKYYRDRAEIFVFTVSSGDGLKGIKPALKFFTKDWSISRITWINDKSIALAVYEEQRWSDGSKTHYQYYKADISN